MFRATSLQRPKNLISMQALVQFTIDQVALEGPEGELQSQKTMLEYFSKSP